MGGYRSDNRAHYTINKAVCHGRAKDKKEHCEREGVNKLLAEHLCLT